MTDNVKELVQRTVEGVEYLAQSAAPTSVSTWQDSDPKSLRQAMVTRKRNRKALMKWVADALVDGIDFGRIHFVRSCDNKKNCNDPTHFSKPSLWKPGAEKIAGMLGLRSTWPELLAEMQSLKDGAKIVTLRCQLIGPDGNIVSEGVGARSLEQDYNDPNKALKMAKKSALIDAVLNAAGLSEVFTQDLSDEDKPGGGGPTLTLTDEGIDYLSSVARECFPDSWRAVLESLARRRFRLEDGNWKNIPDARLADAVRSLQEKAQKSPEPDSEIPQ